jgi:hypothetical protein
MQRKASRAGRRTGRSLSCSACPPVAAKAAAGCTHCCFGVTHAMRSRHQRSRAENVPYATASLKRKAKAFCDFHVEDGDCLWTALENGVKLNSRNMDFDRRTKSAHLQLTVIENPRRAARSAAQGAAGVGFCLSKPFHDTIYALWRGRRMALSDGTLLGARPSLEIPD